MASTAFLLGAGLIFGLKHALDADHVAAVSTIVGDSKSVVRSLMIGALWGVGHTISLLVAAVAVIVLHVEITAHTALALEFCVALMLIGLGANVLRTVSRGGHIHLHAHAHDGHVHIHPHLHDGAPEPSVHTHHGFALSLRPVLIGMVHGLAGSAALMMLVLSTIPSPVLALLYVAVFGIGSIGGMVCMSALVALPARLSATRLSRAHVTVRALAGVFSLGFGLFMAFGIARGLLL